MKIARFFTTMQITKTDLQKAVAYLDDAAKLYAAMDKPKHLWRAVLIRRLTAKFNSILKSDGSKQQ